jgi:hypothetical protein
MNSRTRPSHAGNSKSLEMPADNRFIHHRNHHPDTTREEVEEAEEAEEVEEEDYLLQRDQACFHHTDKPPTLTSSWEVNQKHLQEIGRKSSPSLHSGSCTAESTPTTWQSKTNTRKQCCSSLTSKEILSAPGSSVAVARATCFF